MAKSPKQLKEQSEQVVFTSLVDRTDKEIESLLEKELFKDEPTLTLDFHTVDLKVVAAVVERYRAVGWQVEQSESGWRLEFNGGDFSK